MKLSKNQLLLVVILFVNAVNCYAQDGTYRKTAISFDLTRMMTNEINISYERFISQRKSIQFSGGIIYVNDFLEERAQKWTDQPLFSEHGFALRFHYKIFRRQDNNTKWKDYISAGFTYKHLYYNNRPGETEIRRDSSNYNPHDSSTYTSIYSYTIQYLQDRVRDKYGVEFLWGHVYEMSKAFAFEFYYGGGLQISTVERTDHSRYVHYTKPENQDMNFYYPTYIDYSVYLRPVVLLGAKFRMRF